MDKKEVETAFDIKMDPYDVKKLRTLPNYKKELSIFDTEDRERRIRVKKVITDLESRRSRLSSKKVALILATYLIAITAAEIVTAHYSVEIGIAMHTLILFALLVNSSLTSSSMFSNLLRSMMILPMIRIIGLSIPIMQVQPLYWFPIIAIPLFGASFTLMRTQKLTRKKVGLIVGNIPLQLAIALSGVVLGFVEYMILKPQPLISSFTFETVLIGGVILLISTGFAEELLFRGILQRNAENVLGNIYGLIYTAVLFTALHIGWNSTLDLLFVFGVAIFYGYAFQKTRSLFGITFSHGISNTFLFLIVPFIFPWIAPHLNNIVSGIIPYINSIISFVM